MPLNRQEMILLIAAGAEGPYDLDPIRVMKACFLISQRGRPDWRDEFAFSAYDYGPFDSQVYNSRDALIDRGQLVADESRRYPAYTLSEAGRTRAAEVAEEIGRENAEWFKAVGQYVTSKSFSNLLREVYAEYPGFAVNSVMT